MKDHVWAFTLQRRDWKIVGGASSIAESDSIRYLPNVKRFSATEVARNFSAVLDSVERDQEEIILVRNRRQVARLVPEPPSQDALAVFGDLFRTLDDATADALTRAMIRGSRRRQFSAISSCSRRTQAISKTSRD